MHPGVVESDVTGIEVGDRVTETSHAYDLGTVVLTTFCAWLVKGEPIATEHSELHWCGGPERQVWPGSNQPTPRGK